MFVSSLYIPFIRPLYRVTDYIIPYFSWLYTLLFSLPAQEGTGKSRLIAWKKS
ncbi:hypothetical protein HMPREF3182_01398 [Megasphaera hutchinsoni]|uniref:Uncharacterized protein n=1 Tax=Megasphaera hutchinsoni TaxID=1588748 RepID=A0A134CD23_9FIRM|nr:hypothetical protein HMPREF3182_01398 [Megasphaera hutchinsoni]